MQPEFGGSKGIEGAHRSGHWKWWLLFVPAMVIVGGALMVTLVPREDGFYGAVSTLAVSVATTVFIAPVCQSLRTKLAVRKKHEHTKGQDIQRWWYLMLLSLVVAIEAVLIYISLLLINELYWKTVRAGVRENLAMLAAIVPLVASYCVGTFLILSLRKHLRERRITLRGLVVYAAGATLTLALPFCIRREYWWGHLAVSYLTVRWSALGVSLLSLAVIGSLTLRVRPL
jgi:hypothetical protein